MNWSKEFQHMAGKWTGIVRTVDPKGSPMGTWTLDVDCSIAGNTLSIHNTRKSEDGTISKSRVSGKISALGDVAIASDAISGRAWGSDGAVLAEWHLNSDPSVSFWELSLIHDHNYRTRTWHHLKCGLLTAVSILEEHRVG